VFTGCRTWQVSTMQTDNQRMGCRIDTQWNAELMRQVGHAARHGRGRLVCLCSCVYGWMVRTLLVSIQLTRQQCMLHKLHGNMGEWCMCPRRSASSRSQKCGNDDAASSTVRSKGTGQTNVFLHICNVAAAGRLGIGLLG
jgi:hypothetical protein